MRGRRVGNYKPHVTALIIYAQDDMVEIQVLSLAVSSSTGDILAPLKKKEVKMWKGRKKTFTVCYIFMGNYLSRFYPFSSWKFWLCWK